jgi:hypothetical protein
LPDVDRQDVGVSAMKRLRDVAQELLGPDETVRGAFICPRRPFGVLGLAGMLLGPLGVLFGSGGIGWRAVAVTTNEVVVLGKFSIKGYPTTVLERFPMIGSIEHPDELAGDPTVVVGGERYYVSGEHLDEAHRLSRLIGAHA